jgi:hypothetical protein
MGLYAHGVVFFARRSFSEGGQAKTKRTVAHLRTALFASIVNYLLLINSRAF